jgi:putative DNA primase/helicase
VQRYVGSALTADVGDQSLVLLYGPGANGKSTFLETIQAALGDYSHKAAFDTLLEASGRSDRRGAARADLLALRGSRCVTAVEASEGRRLDEQLVKELTGGDTITARGLYHSEQTSFAPVCKLALAVNHRPEVRGSDEAIWRRVLEVPFIVTIPEAERDPRLLERLREPNHLRAVLAWAVAGCRDWLNPPSGKTRLRAPEAVVAASRAYRLDQDELLPFIEDCCVLDPNGRVSNKELRASYRAWASANGVKPLGPKQLPRRLQDHGCHSCRVAGGRGWAGIFLSGQATQVFEGSR